MPGRVPRRVCARQEALGARSRVPEVTRMTGPDAFDDTTDDHNQFETELLAQDMDASSVPTADIDEGIARHTVDELVDAGRVTPVPGDRVFVHEPSGGVFDSITQLAVFHRGWTAGRHTAEEDENLNE